MPSGGGFSGGGGGMPSGGGSGFSGGGGNFGGGNEGFAPRGDFANRKPAFARPAGKVFVPRDAAKKSGKFSKPGRD